MAGKTVADLLKIAGGDTVITSILRAGEVRISLLPDAKLNVGDVSCLSREITKLSTGWSRRPSSA